VDRSELEALFLEHLPRIERTIGSLARRHGFRDAEAADLSSWIKLRLIEDDYGVLRKFRGESAITTYLTVVIATLVQDYRVQKWGRWRPSAAALRQGGVAMKLEALVYRQGYELKQAAEVIRSSGETRFSDRELAAMLAELPTRVPLRPREVGEEPIAELPASAAADSAYEHSVAQAERHEVEAALRRALDQLPAEDRCILLMRYWQDMSVADIARALSLQQKPLYKRLDKLLGELRRLLTQFGVAPERAMELVNEVAR
jgi:RNA polymerase sigma factor for flagellar operon FliA